MESVYLDIRKDFFNINLVIAIDFILDCTLMSIINYMRWHAHFRVSISIYILTKAIGVQCMCISLRVVCIIFLTYLMRGQLLAGEGHD